MVDFDNIKTYPIGERANKFNISQSIATDNSLKSDDEDIKLLGKKIAVAKKNDCKTILMFGGAVIKEGCSLLIIDMMKNGFIHHIGINGAVSIHDFEVAMIGETSEDVTNGLQDGTFGMVEETGALMNEALKAGVKKGLGYGYSIAEKIEQLDLKYKEYSVLYNALKLNIPVSAHVAIGGDIIHQHPTCDGAILGATSFTDFKILTETVSELKGGVLLNVGSAVNLPEAFLKALTIVRNLRFPVEDFTTANFDFLDMYRPRTRLIEWPKVLGCTGFDIIEINHCCALMI